MNPVPRPALALCLLLATAAAAASQTSGREPAGGKVRALVVPARETVISSQMSGRLLQLVDQVGAIFSKGDPLAAFDCSELAARTRMASAEVESAELTLKAKQELLRLQSAGETEVSLAATALARARAQLDLSAVQQQYCVIAAPFDGIVVKAVAREFQSVSPGQALLEIVSRETPKARMNVPAGWLLWLKPGTPFRFAADETGQLCEGTISHVGGRVDAVSQTVEVEGVFGAPSAGLVAGMTGSVTIQKGPGKR